MIMIEVKLTINLIIHFIASNIDREKEDRVILSGVEEIFGGG